MSTIKSVTNSLNNGRSTSQISIYDYPEHLNPFYEDENHKRLRFWKINKNKNKNGSGGSGVSRRGSFSLDGLKEMWAFKSFRLKKKSSTLGINKTSESPPILRRDLYQNESPIYNPEIRQTIQPNGNQHFQRNVPYRMSLQDVRSSSPAIINNEHGNGFGFGRNERYRNTIQTPMRMKRHQQQDNLTPIDRRYVYGGSITPIPPIRKNKKSSNFNNNNNYSDEYCSFNRGSSQQSLESTNPFDDDESLIIGQTNNISSSNPILNKRPARKKRQAPQPPVSSSQVSKSIEEENSQRNLKIIEKNNEIFNLTAEIESFVNNTSNDINDNEKQIKEEKINNEIEIIIENSEPFVVSESNEKILNTNNLMIKENDEVGNNSEEIGQDEDRIERTEIIINTRNLIVEENVNNNDDDDDDEIVAENHQEIEPENIYIITRNTPNEIIIDDEIQENEKNKIITEEILNSAIELKITESVEDLTNVNESPVKSLNMNYPNKTPFEEYQIRYIPLKDSFSSNPHSSPTRPTTPPPPIPATRRRSVRDIIESINRSQSLLKSNQKDLNSNDIMKSDENNLNVITNFEKTNDDQNNINNNIMIFEKCTSYNSRETSPTTANLDWNPVPKPKRTKNYQTN